MVLSGKTVMDSENIWKIIKTYFKGHYLERLVRHQLESYNNFVSHQLQETINMFNPVIINSEHDYDKETDNIN